MSSYNLVQVKIFYNSVDCLFTPHIFATYPLNASQLLGLVQQVPPEECHLINSSLKLSLSLPVPTLCTLNVSQHADSLQNKMHAHAVKIKAANGKCGLSLC